MARIGRCTWRNAAKWLATCIALVLIASVVPLTAATAASCFGKSATIEGTSGSDQLTATGGPDVIAGLGGNDTITGVAGGDAVCAGGGRDLVSLLEPLADVDGGDGSDSISFASATGSVTAHLGIDGRSGASISGHKLKDIENLEGSSFSDRLAGGPETNRLSGGAGDDQFMWRAGDAGDDRWDGGMGTDRVDFLHATGPVTVDLTSGTATVAGSGAGTDLLVAIEDVRGSFFTDSVKGSDADNELTASFERAVTGDADVLEGLAGNDDLIGSAGPVTITGGAEDDDMFSLAYEPITVDGGAGNDTFGFGQADRKEFWFPGTSVLRGGDGDDQFLGTNSDDAVHGEGGNDRLFSMRGNDLIDGGDGSDSASGGLGQDTCVNVESASSCAHDGTADDAPPENSERAGLEANLDLRMRPDATKPGVYHVTAKNRGPAESAPEVGVELFFAGRVLSFEPQSGCSIGAFQTELSCSFRDVPPDGEHRLTVTIDSGSIVAPLHAGVIYHSLVDPSLLFQPPLRDPEWGNNAVVLGGSNLDLVGIEITQGIQNWRNEVTLVAGRPTIVRAHLVSTAGHAEFVEGTLTAKLLGTSSTFGPIAGHKPIEVRTELRRWDPSGALIFELPAEAIADPGTGRGFTLEVTVEGTSRGFACRDIDEDCRATAFFTPVADPDIVFLGLDYIFRGRLVRSTVATATKARSDILQTFPVDRINTFFKTIPDPPEPEPPGAGNIVADLLDFERLWLYTKTAGLLYGCPNPGRPCVWAGVMEPVPPPNRVEGIAGMGMSGAFAAYVDGPDEWTVAHELAHVLGREHTFCPGGGAAGIDENYPHPDGWISTSTEGPDAFFGATVFNGGGLPRIYAPRTDAKIKAGAHDLMSYCSPVWTSDYTWNALLVSLEEGLRLARSARAAATAGAPATASQSILVRGTVSLDDDTGMLAPPLPAVASPITPVAGAYEIRFEDSAGSVLAAYSFQPASGADGPDNAAFVLPLERPEDAARIVLAHGNTVLDSWAAGPGTPSISITSPKANDDLSGDTAAFSWDAQDADGDPLTFLVEYSLDGGSSWRPVVLDHARTSIKVRIRDLAGSDAALLRVVATDGLHSTEDVVGTFVIPKQSPKIALTTAPANRVFVRDQEILLDAVAFDPEDGILSTGAIEWASDRDGLLHTGAPAPIATNDLSLGKHRITVVATDADGATTSKSFLIHLFGDHGSAPRCTGDAATLIASGPGETRGTPSFDVISGTNAREKILGLAATDSLCGAGGRDVLQGGRGRDVLNGGAGADVLNGGSGSDLCIGGRHDRFKSCERRRTA